MHKGDLDNTSPRRWMVTLEALTGGHLLPTKTWRKSWQTVARETPFDRLALGRCWRVSAKLGVQFECVAFGLSTEHCDALEKQLDRMGTHPVTWVNGYQDREALRDSLPFRPDVMAVCDLREYALYWGARGYALEDL